MMKRTKRWMVVGVAVVALAAISVGVVSAHGGGWFGGRDKDSYLADELGITVEELDAAQEAAASRALEDAYAAGDITEEQYQNILAQQALRDYADTKALTAEVLGITEDQLAEKSLSEWLDELGMDRADFAAQLQAAYEAKITEAVADGVIPQEQADAMGTMHGGMMGGRGHGRGHGDDFDGTMFDGGRMPRGGVDSDTSEDSLEQDGSFDSGLDLSGTDA